MAKLYESVFKEDLTKLDAFKQQTGLLELDDTQFQNALERLEDILTIFEIEPAEIREFGVLLAKFKDGTISNDESNYFYKLIANYFKEKLKLVFISRFREADEDEVVNDDVSQDSGNATADDTDTDLDSGTSDSLDTDNVDSQGPRKENILFMPLTALLLRNGFLSKISVANQADYETIKKEIEDKKSDITKLLTEDPQDGIAMVNNALMDGIKNSSYINNPIANSSDKEGEGDIKLTSSDWFDKYASDDVLDDLAQKVEDNKFEFKLDIGATNPNAPELSLTNEPGSAPPVEGGAGGGASPGAEPAPLSGGGGGGPAPAGGEEIPVEGAEGEIPVEGEEELPPEGEAPVEETPAAAGETPEQL